MTSRNRQEKAPSTGAEVLAVPEGFGLVLDPGTRRVDGGAVLIGGSPLTVLRLSGAGARLVDELVAGAPVPGGAGNRLARRMLDLGLVHPRPPAGRQGREVTVVIPVRDDAAGLAATLARVGPVANVVVVDDGSVDARAVSRAAALGPQHVQTVLLRLERSAGPGVARQVGWKAATTDVIAFLDAGCRPEPGWLDPLVAHLADPAVAAVAPRVTAVAASGTPPWLVAYEALRSPLDLGPSAACVRPRSRVPYVPTAALVVRRAALEAVGGFDPTLRFGEDVDLVWRLAAAGRVVRYEPAATVAHPPRPTLGGLLRQRFDYGSSAASLAERHGAAVAPLVVSGWSALAWALAIAGHPLLAAGVAGATTAALVPRVRGLDHPWREAIRLAGGGHLRSGQLVAEACRRTWWPLVAVACFGSAHARRAAVVLAVVPPLLERRPRRGTLGTPAWLALRLTDDMAYGLGVWVGATRSRSPAALRPASTAAPGRRRLALRMPPV